VRTAARGTIDFENPVVTIQHQRGNVLHAPDIYMDKIAVGGRLPPGVVNLDDSVATNLRNLALARTCDIADLMVCLLDRDRHERLIAHCREAGARVMLISDGDVAGAIATGLPDSQIDMYLGAGGAPEGVLAAAALRCVDGQMQGRLLFDNRFTTLPQHARFFNLLFLLLGGISGATGLSPLATLQASRLVFALAALTLIFALRPRTPEPVPSVTTT